MKKSELLALLKIRVAYGLMQGGWVPKWIGRPLKSGMRLADGWVKFEESSEYKRLKRLEGRLGRLSYRELKSLYATRLYAMDRTE